MTMPKPEPLTRADWIYLWKTESGSMSWRRWCQLNDIPEKNPAFIEELAQAGMKKVEKVEKNTCALNRT